MTNSIITRVAVDANVEETLQQESDVIVTSVILGFICTRYYQNQPCQFDFEHPSKGDMKSFAELDIENRNFITEKTQKRVREYLDTQNVWEGDKIQVSKKIRELIEQDSDNFLSGLSTENRKSLANDVVESINDNWWHVWGSWEDIKAPVIDIIARKIESTQKYYEDFIEDIRKHDLVLDALSDVLNKQESGMGKWLKDGQSPFGEEGSLITGKKGSEMLQPDIRATKLSISKAIMLENAQNKKKNVYQGRGAYTGLVENPLEPDNNLYPTMRVTPEHDIRPWAGIDPGDPNQANDGNMYYWNWGLIANKRIEGDGRNTTKQSITLDADLKIGMGTLPNDNNNEKIGYIHGMCSAIIKCEEHGPWCTPYEMATGDKTTKMASCFPCATFMYATGYPPTSIHLGRGESWVPPQAGPRMEEADNVQLGTNLNPGLCKHALEAWNTQIYNYMTLGLQCLEKAKIYAADSHFNHIENFRARLQHYDTQSNVRTSGGSLFLDALTMHDKEVNRIKRTLAPAFNAERFIREQMFKTH